MLAIIQSAACSVSLNADHSQPFPNNQTPGTKQLFHSSIVLAIRKCVQHEHQRCSLTKTGGIAPRTQHAYTYTNEHIKPHSKHQLSLDGNRSISEYYQPKVNPLRVGQGREYRWRPRRHHVDPWSRRQEVRASYALRSNMNICFCFSI